MADGSPFPFGDSDDDSPNPFAGLPFFGEMMKMFADQGPVQWDTARQVALLTATGGQTESNPDPTARMSFVDLGRIVVDQLEAVTERALPVLAVEPAVVTRTAWVDTTLEDYRPFFTDLATALAQKPTDTDDDPMAAMLGQFSGLLAPTMMGMTVGSMVGLLAKRSLGQYDLPLPRRAGRAPMFVLTNIDEFATEWNLSTDDARMWTLISELTLHTIISIPHVASEVERLVCSHVAAFRPDPNAIMDKLSSIESSDPMQIMQSLQNVLGDPEVLLGAMRSPEQDRLQPHIDTVLSLVVGWADHIADQVGARILGNPARIAEAARRRRIESGEETTFVERLLGLRLDRSRVEQGKSFVAGVVERAGARGLDPLFDRTTAIPTPAELDAPGLWLARLEISDAD
ncbi:MAG: zinc-dependent metalloprotease [Actinomycetota bacterium]|nr:zinc-dependent metalloprotease [Actinomycetota bacterium]MDA2972014.1 zinc-dependent metalloprotease [Actinomycetota bacterium]MDA3000438.1 zinc-dependent metalloprotease [Actinomycetota bacterium]